MARRPRRAKICQSVILLLKTLNTTSWIEIASAAAMISATPRRMFSGLDDSLLLKSLFSPQILDFQPIQQRGYFEYALRTELII